MKRIVFIGSGNMAGAMIRGMLSSGAARPEQIVATGATGKHFAALEALGIAVTRDNRAAARQADMLVLAVKPHQYAAVAEEIRAVTKPEAVLVPIAAGQSMAAVEAMFGGKRKVVRVLPNTPAMVGQAMTAYCANPQVSPEELAEVRRLLESFGLAEQVPESLMDAVTGVSGSSPAYVYLFLEALADGAVREGMPRGQAYRFAAQAALGAAKMVLETGQHPGALKDAVCSPGGTTIEAVAKLEELGLRRAVLEAERACVEKSRAMS